MIAVAAYIAAPFAFLFFLCVFALLLLWLKRFASVGPMSQSARDPYACGQRDFESYVNPDYTQFFRYAFVFSVMHVLTLVVATAPKDASLMPAAYIACGVLTLAIIFRK